MRHAMVGTIAALAILAATAGSRAATTPSPLAAILADPGRPEADRARDADRKPAELIAFAKLRRGASVAELAPGGGYFTRLLSAFVGPKGHIYAVAARPSPALTEIAGSHPNVSIVAGKPGEIPVPAPVDMVWTTLNYHDFKNSKQGDTDAAALFNQAAFKALKSGGIYLIVDHQAAPGAGASVTSTLHRIESVVANARWKAPASASTAKATCCAMPPTTTAWGSSRPAYAARPISSSCVSASRADRPSQAGDHTSSLRLISSRYQAALAPPAASPDLMKSRRSIALNLSPRVTPVICQRCQEGRTIPAAIRAKLWPSRPISRSGRNHKARSSARDIAARTRRPWFRR